MAEPPAQVVDGCANGVVCANRGSNTVDRVEDRRVVSPADSPADLWQAVFGELTREVHRHLARRGDGWTAVARQERLSPQGDQALRIEPETGLHHGATNPIPPWT